MKHINLTNWRGSITDWTKLNYIYGGLDDSYAVKGNLRIDKDNYNYVEFRECYNKFDFNENVISVATGTTPHSINLTLDDTDKIINAKTTDTYSRAIVKLSENLIPGTTYTFSFNIVTNTNIVRIALSSIGSHIDDRDYGYLNSVNTGVKSLTFTAVNNKLFLHLYLCNSPDNNCDMTMSNIMLNIGETALTYEPYFTGKKYVITENLGIVDLGSLNYTYNTSYLTPMFQTPRLSNMIPNSLDILCPLYVAENGFWLTADNYFKISFGNSNINISNSDYTDPALFKPAMSGVNVIYKLATPVIEVVE